MIARRALLAGLPAAGLVTAVPALAATETTGLVGLPLAAVHAEKVAAAMAMPEAMGSWVVTIKSGDAKQPIFFQNGVQAAKDAALLRFLATAEDRDIAQYHAGELAKAMQRIQGGMWTLTISEKDNFVLLSGDPKSKYPSVVQRFTD